MPGEHSWPTQPMPVLLEPFDRQGVGEDDLIDFTPVLRAHDKATGEILAEIELPGTQTGLPMSYVLDGRQYIAVAVTSGDAPAEIVALGLGK